MVGGVRQRDPADEARAATTALGGAQRSEAGARETARNASERRTGLNLRVVVQYTPISAVSRLQDASRPSAVGKPRGRERQRQQVLTTCPSITQQHTHTLGQLAGVKMASANLAKRAA